LAGLSRLKKRRRTKGLQKRKGKKCGISGKKGGLMGEEDGSPE